MLLRFALLQAHKRLRLDIIYTVRFHIQRVHAALAEAFVYPFEETAGISKYRHRKEETERKLAHTEDNLLRIGDKVSELEMQLEPLKQQSEKAKKYLELKDELQGVEIAVWLDTLDKLSAAAKKAEEDFASASFVLQQAHEDLDKLYAQSEEMGSLLRHRDEELENIRMQVSLLDATHQQLDGQMAVLQENCRALRGELGGKMGKQLRIVPEIAFYLDSSLDYVEHIEELLKK